MVEKAASAAASVACSFGGGVCVDGRDAEAVSLVEAKGVAASVVAGK